MSKSRKQRWCVSHHACTKSSSSPGKYESLAGLPVSSDASVGALIGSSGSASAEAAQPILSLLGPALSSGGGADFLSGEKFLFRQLCAQ